MAPDVSFPRMLEFSAAVATGREFWIPARAGMTKQASRRPMPCVLGLDIGTTSTIGILIRPPDETLALASRSVTLRSDHVGWAEEDPEQWWSNVGEIVRELVAYVRRFRSRHRRGRRDRHVAGCGVARFRRAPAEAQHSAKRRALRRGGRGAPRRNRRKGVSRQSRQRNQSATRGREAPLDRAARARCLRAHRHRVWLLRLYQLAPDWRARHRAELGARSGIRRP